MSYYELQEYMGHTFVMPALDYLRNFVEGPDAPRWENWEIRQYKPRETPFFDIYTIMIIVLIATFFTLLEPIARKLYDKLVCKPVGMSVRDSTRCTESLWQMTFYTNAWLYSCYIVASVEWASKTYLCWEQPFPNQEIEFNVYTLYLVQIGWYLHCLWCHLAHDVRKSDFWVMLAHHVVALMLLYCSFATGYHRVGILVLYCLDGCDIFLHFTKVMRFVANYWPKSKWFEVACYLSVLISWSVFRLYMFVETVLYTSFVQALHYPGWQNCDYWFGFNLLLIIIYLMQIYWFYLILLAGYRAFKLGEEFDDCRDPTSDKANTKAAKRKKM